MVGIVAEGSPLPRRGRGARGPGHAGDAAHAPAVGASAPLARYTESASPSPLLVPAGTVKINSDGVIADGHEKRLLRWELQHAARELLGTKHRVGVCHRVPSRFAGEGETPGVKVYRRADSATYYRGLMVCANVWACPVCSTKIAERRRAELEQAITRHLGNGGAVYHMLLTVPHSRRDTPLGLLTDLLEAFRLLCSGKYRLSALVPGYVGLVRSLEVTHGEHGWHPHLHVLVFTAAPLDDQVLDLVQHKVWGKWEARVFKRMGKMPSRKAYSFAGAIRGNFEEQHLRVVHEEVEHVCPVTGYVTKFGADREIEEIVKRRRWGAADELTKGHLKTAGRGGRSPWQLLADYQDGDVHAGMLWKEFAVAFKGRAQLYWSAGLREGLGLDAERTDEEVAASVDAQDALLARITVEDWALIVRHKLRGVVLEVLRVGEWADVARMLDPFRGAGPPGAPKFSAT